MEFFRRFVDGEGWQLITLSDEEVTTIKKQTLEKNINLLKKLKEKFPELSEIERASLFNTLATTFWHEANLYVDKKIYMK
jgi:phosphoserine aminotransferase